MAPAPQVSLEAWHEPAAASGPEPGQTGGEKLETQERAEAVRRAVAALPPDQREALVLFEYEELSHAEIAVALGGTPKAVEARLYRALGLPAGRPAAVVLTTGPRPPAQADR